MTRTFTFIVLSCLIIGAFAQFKVTEILKDDVHGAHFKAIKTGDNEYEPNLDELDIQYSVITEDILRFTIRDSNADRWEVTDYTDVINNISKLKSTREEGQDENLKNHIHKTNYKWAVPAIGEDLEILIWRSISSKGNDLDVKTIKSSRSTSFDRSILFDSSFSSIAYSDHFLSISNRVASNPNIYGLGERIHNLRLNPWDKTYTIYNYDLASPLDRNIYGSQPFYLEHRPTEQLTSHGVLLMNSNAMDVHIGPNHEVAQDDLDNPQNVHLLTYRVIGGVLDFFIFVGPNPSSTINQFTSLVGNTVMPAWRHLGMHQCRWGYESLADTIEVVNQYEERAIPIDYMWSDIDYMESYRMFTNDPEKFPADEAKEFVAYLHDTNRGYIVILDPGVFVQKDGTYEPYESLIDGGLYIREADGVTPLVGKVWPGPTIFPDFLHENIQDWWTREISEFLSSYAPVDGLWIDMNEIASFCDGPCSDEELGSDWDLGAMLDRVIDEEKHGAAASSNDSEFNPDYPPYSPGSDPLNSHTISLTAMHAGGLSEYDVHNIYALLETMATRTSLLELEPNKRPFVLSRANFITTGAHGYHWLGDNHSTWESLYYSYSGILTMQMFGIPYVGADIGGFTGDSNAELVTRWSMAAAFSPFTRNHNALGSAPQEPYVFGEPYESAIADSIQIKYYFLSYWYTAFHVAHKRGGTVLNPVFFIAPNDPVAVNIETQMVLSDGLMVAPVLEPAVESVEVYFPADTVWYDYRSGARHGSNKPEKGSWERVSAPIDVLPVFVRGGSIITTQVPAMTATETRLNPFGLLIGLNPASPAGYAEGYFYYDDGESLEVDEDQRLMSLFQFVRMPRTGNAYIGNSVFHQGKISPPSSASLSTITIHGIDFKPYKVLINPFSTKPSRVYMGNVNYCEKTGSLTITGLSLRMEDDWAVGLYSAQDGVYSNINPDEADWRTAHQK